LILLVSGLTATAGAAVTSRGAKSSAKGTQEFAEVELATDEALGRVEPAGTGAKG
jgi:hypothetical protein